MFELTGKKVWVAGHNGLVGSALCARLQQENCQLLTVEKSTVDLRNQAQVYNWLDQHQPEVIILAAAKVGGIQANLSYPAEFIYDNLAIQCNVIHGAYQYNVKKLLFLGSSCIYPRNCMQPIKPEYLLSSALESSNEYYAVAKIAGIKLCQGYRQQYQKDFIAAMPSNLYGKNDNFDLENSHVIPALIRKIHHAKMQDASIVTIWGSGHPLREFLYIEDLADALIFLLKFYSSDKVINVGTGSEISIASLTELIADIIGFQGEITYDRTKPDGTPRKCMDVSELNRLGWSAQTTLRTGLALTYDWYRSKLENLNDPLSTLCLNLN